MNVTHLEELEQSKTKVYIDYEYAFILNDKDIRHYKLSEGVNLSLELYDEIYDTICQRAKQKALSILKFMDRTEFELRKKLSDSGYNENIIDKTIQYINEYGYLDDKRLASSYIRARMNRKSKLVIKTELLHKGINKDIIDAVLLEEYQIDKQEDAEIVAIQKAISKKTKSPESLDYEGKQKLIASLYRKGFDVNKIKQIIN